MNHVTMKRRIALLMVVALLLSAAVLAGQAPAEAQVAIGTPAPASTGSTGYDLSWWTVDGGAAAFRGEGYVLDGTAGQPDAGVLSGGDYTLSGGFWGVGAASAAGRQLYLPLVMRRFP
jgi:hypothetical protein